ncbi:DUF1464 family protein [Geoglobus acetivorans]|uniref:DUF1464 family protein n=1 Tax=Geoglobus acetivorans TaxID=565033 RepID=A0ABZ3H6M9_GEOAI|nr:DUF1464 family protein [Geoglobus acetivorans]
MVSAGIDAGTKSYAVYVFEDGRYFEIDTSAVKANPEDFVEFLDSLEIETGAGLSGYGLPVKRIYEVDDHDLRMMTLNFDETATMGMRKVIDLVREKKLEIYTIPAVIHLNTVPDHRKINRIDMGTYDKVCSVAFVLHEFGIDQSFVLAELGYGFNAFIAVENGKIVDGLGGTSGFPGFSSLSSIDAELAYLLKDINKDLVFSGGLKSYFEDRNMGFNADIFSEWVMKGIYSLKAVVDFDNVYLSGRFADHVHKRVSEEFNAVNLGRIGRKISAIGASVIASGISGKDGRDVVESLEILKASGTVLDHLTSDVAGFLRENITFNIHNK